MPLARAHWRKSSYSGQSGSCVEVSVALTRIGVCDTKDRRHTLTFNRNAWTEFVNAIKAERLTT